MLVLFYYNLGFFFFFLAPTGQFYLPFLDCSENVIWFSKESWIFWFLSISHRLMFHKRCKKCECIDLSDQKRKTKQGQLLLWQKGPGLSSILCTFAHSQWEKSVSLHFLIYSCPLIYGTCSRDLQYLLVEYQPPCECLHFLVQPWPCKQLQSRNSRTRTQQPCATHKPISQNSHPPYSNPSFRPKTCIFAFPINSSWFPSTNSHPTLQFATPSLLLIKNLSKPPK